MLILENIITVNYENNIGIMYAKKEKNAIT